MSAQELFEFLDSCECDRCGACCKHLLVEASFVDAQREPRLYQIEKIDRVRLRAGEATIMLYDFATRQCPFLQSDDKCSCTIYPTRPYVCVEMQAGDFKCQQARIAAGLGLLRNSFGEEPSLKVLTASADEYDLEVDDLWIWEEGK